MSTISVKQALELWQQAGLIDSGKAGQLDDWLGEYQHQHPHIGDSSRLVAVFSVIGAVLAGLGLVLFVAGHWDAMGPQLRIAVLIGAYLVTVGVALLAWRADYQRVAAALWLMASLLVGANIFLIGQIFNLSLTFWQGPLLWMIAVLFMGWATQSSLQAWLAIPLALLALGWFGGGEGWFRDDQIEFLVSPSGLRPLLPVLGLCLVSLGLLARGLQSWRFAASTWLAWGVVLALVPVLIASFDHEVFRWVFEMQPVDKQWVIVAVSVALLVLALLLGRFRAPHTGMALLFLALVAYMLLIVSAFDLRDYFQPLAAYAAFLIAIFISILVVVWAGASSREPALVSIGIVAASVFIMAQYFSWSLALLDRALAFIIGGVLLIGIAWWGERQRRRLLREMAA